MSDSEDCAEDDVETLQVQCMCCLLKLNTVFPQFLAASTINLRYFTYSIKQYCLSAMSTAVSAEISAVASAGVNFA